MPSACRSPAPDRIAPLSRSKSSSSPSYAVVRYRVPSALVRTATDALLRERFLGWAVSTPAGRHAELDLYASTRAPAHAIKALAALGLEPYQRTRIPERELLRDVIPEEPCRLVQGVWIDHAGDMEERPGQVVLRLPLIAAFGDGRHPSTRIGARLLRRAQLRRQRVLDLGCGTGVLGLLAGRWGARSVDFADLDADAVRATRAACQLNGLRPGKVLRSDLLSGITGPYTVLIGNLYADLVLRLVADPRLTTVLPHGTLVISGVHHSRIREVRAGLGSIGFRIQAQARDGLWHGLRLRR